MSDPYMTVGVGVLAKLTLRSHVLMTMAVVRLATVRGGC